MADSYLTIGAPSEGRYTEKMSRFLAFACPASDAAEAKATIAAYANKYHDARHVCWAYMVGPDRTEYQSSDNGEPSGTAGKPILGQINSFGLTDIVIVVVRYFGGIKLGTSGLISAYREASREAIQAAEIVERRQMATLTFTFPYLAMNDVMRLVKTSGATIAAQSFDNTCSMTLALPLDAMQALRPRLENIGGVSIAQGN